MDPVQFRIDWEVLAEVLVTLTVLAFLVERALSIVFENKLFVNSKLDENGIKEILAFFAALLVVRYVHLDALAVIFKMEAPRWPGMIVTAAVVAGGSKASLKLFQDVMNLKSSARRQKDEIQKVARENAIQQMRESIRR